MARADGLFARVVGPLSDRPRQLIGALLGAVGAGHFALWTQTAGSSLPTAAAAGDAAAVLSQVVSYGQHHPAYVVALVLGIAVLLRPDWP